MQFLLIFFACAFGAAIGSFLNVVAYRLPRRQHFLTASSRSHCPRCRRRLPWYDLIPVASYLLLRGHCRRCHKPIRFQYLAMELATAALFGLAVWQHGLSAAALVGVVGGSFFIILGLIDAQHGIVPDAVSIPAIITVGMLQLGAAVRFGAYGLQVDDLRAAGLILAAGALGACWFAIQWLVSRGRWVGSGDIRLGALLGLYLGLPGVVLAFLLAYISGTVGALTLLVRGRATMKSALPFGAYLAGAGIVTYFFGSQVFTWYQHAIGLT